MLLVDCGATDLSKFGNFDDSFKSETNYIELANGLKSNNVALQSGGVKMTLMDDNEKYVNVILKNTLYIPSYTQDIFSAQGATGKGASVIFKPECARLTYKDDTNFDITNRDRYRPIY